MIILIIILTIASLIYFVFLLFVITGIRKVDKFTKTENVELPHVSVIVPFRNEKDNIEKSLNSLLGQNYPTDKFEIIYADDNSTDNSVDVIRRKGNDRIKIVQIKGNFTRGHKKKVLNEAVERSHGDIIITTDADCVHSENWLGIMIRQFDRKTAFISGPVKFAKGKSFLDKLQALEFSGLILTGAGLIGNGFPTLCNGANIAYRKSAFQAVNGYSGNEHLSSGDDEFLMQKIAAANIGSVEFCLDRDAVVETQPKKRISDFINQRRRWASKGFFYRNKKLVSLLILIFLFFFFLFVSFFLGLILSKELLLIVAVIIIMKSFLEYSVLRFGKGILIDQIEFSVFCAAELLHVPYILISSILGSIGKFEWKGRSLER